VIAFGVCVGSRHKFVATAVPGLRRCAEDDSPVAEATEQTSIFKAYNEMLDAFGPMSDLEALVLLHEDVELQDPAFCTKVRRRLADETIAIIGAVGARGVPGLAWWGGKGFGRVAESRGTVDFGGGCHDVDAVDGLLLVLSPWAVRTLRFDATTFDGFHGYDVDICFQARALGRRVVVDDVALFHYAKGGYGDHDAWERADSALRRKWLMAPDATTVAR
jgi:hypothetical protein